VAARIAAGEWVVDLRNRRAFAAGHVSGSLSFEHGGDFTTYLGWLIPWGTPLTLLSDTPGPPPPPARHRQRSAPPPACDAPAGQAPARRGNEPGEGTGAPRRILDERLARGEINAAEYQRLRDLTAAGNGQAPAGTRGGQ
jgi:hypothetical protein